MKKKKPSMAERGRLRWAGVSVERRRAYARRIALIRWRGRKGLGSRNAA